MDFHREHVAAALHVAGFLCGFALYGMLLVLALRRSGSGYELRTGPGIDPLPIITGIAGMTWNAGALIVHGFADLSRDAPPAYLAASAFASLGFLPAVAAHSILRPTQPTATWRMGRWLVAGAYGISGWAAILHFSAAATNAPLPSGGAFRLLTAGYILLMFPLVLAARRQALWRRAVMMLALGVFGVSAIHLVEHQGFTGPLIVQVLGHHASLPLAIAILVQDYPFAFGDILLKRMLALGALVVITLGGFFALLRSPLLSGSGGDADRPEFVVAMLMLALTVALSYPWIRRRAAVFVDRFVLKRADPAAVLSKLASLASERESVDALVNDAGAILTTALSAPATTWDFQPRSRLEQGVMGAYLEADGRSARLVIPTADSPNPEAVIGPLAGGRRFLAADLALLREASLVLARRIDAIRLEHERFERRWREEEMARLAADAELRALRAQINPHFLFNALTTIGYLVKAAPDRALHTLLRLTEVLRRVLRSDEDDVTLANELQLVEAYLDIERARFEERLQIEIDVPDAVRNAKIPAFVLQPLVENAVKHGIAPSRTGGVVSVRARIKESYDHDPDTTMLELTVSDTGSGREAAASNNDGQGIGLANVRRRLDLKYGSSASVRFAVDPNSGTEAIVTIPCPNSRPEARHRRRNHKEEEGRP
jgi:two-component system, LytTR family, sensor kinase